MSETISSQNSWPTGSIALAAAVLVLGMGGVCGSANIARADDCLTAPNSAAPQGSHWYYHLDRATQHKCWYLRAPGQSSAKATARPTATAEPASEPASPVPVNSSAPPASTSVAPSGGDPVPMSADNGASPPPHVTMLAVKPQTDAVTGAAVDNGVQRTTRGASAEPSMPQTLAPRGNTSQATGPEPAASVAQPDATPAVARPGLKKPISDADADSIRAEVDGAVSSAQRPARSSSAGMMGALATTPVELFVIFAIVLAMAGILVRAVMNVAAARRERAIANHSEPGWADDQQEYEAADAEYQDHQRWHDLVDQQELDRIDHFPTERIYASTARHRDPAPASAEPQLGPSLDDLQEALRVVKRARQNWAA